MVFEIGVFYYWVVFNVYLVVDGLCEVVVMMIQIVGQLIFFDVFGNFVMGVCQVVGVVLGIVFWNVFVILGVCVVVFLLVCGNIVIFKGFEICLVMYGFIIDVFQDVGLLFGVVNFIINVLEDVGKIVEVIIVDLVV